MKYVPLALFVCIAFFYVYQAIRVYGLIRISKKLSEVAVPFSYIPSNGQMMAKKIPTRSKKLPPSFLFMGDSLGVGVGATSPEHSIAGLLSHDYPQAEVVNVSVRGSRIADVLDIARSLRVGLVFDVVVIQVGANDIVRMTPLGQASDDLESLLAEMSKHARRVVFLTSGNVGDAPLFPFPFNFFYSTRSKIFFDRFKVIAGEHSVSWVDLYYSRGDDPFLTNIPLYYAADRFHVTDAAYAVWYEKIQKVME